MSTKIVVPEYKSECSIPGSQLRKLSDIDILVLKVFNPYRYGWDDSVKKYRSFYYFPTRLKQEVVYSGDAEAKVQEGDTFNLREKFWDNEMKKFAFRKVIADASFYKTFKKVFDVDVSPSSPCVFKIWDSNLKEEIDVTLGRGNTFTVRAVSSSRIIGMIEAHELDADVELVDGKDKAGNPAKVRPYDFEEKLIGELSGRFIKFKVRGEGLDTRFTFKEGKEFDLAPTPVGELTDAEIPF